MMPVMVIYGGLLGYWGGVMGARSARKQSHLIWLLVAFLVYMSLWVAAWPSGLLGVKFSDNDYWTAKKIIDWHYSSPGPNTRLLDQLGPAGRRRIVPKMIQFLHDPDIVNRDSAIQALQYVGQDARDAIPTLEDLAQHDKAPPVRFSATRALIEMKGDWQQLLDQTVQTLEAGGPWQPNLYEVSRIATRHPGLNLSRAIAAVKILMKSPDREARIEAERTLREIDPISMQKSDLAQFNEDVKAWEHGDRNAFGRMFSLCNGTNKPAYCNRSPEELARWFKAWWPNAREGVGFVWADKDWQMHNGTWNYKERPKAARGI
jgi:hypothetical protein